MRKLVLFLTLVSFRVALGLAAEPTPPPAGLESNGTPIRVMANFADAAPAPAFVLASIVVCNEQTGELRTLAAFRTAADSRLYKVEFLSDGSAKLWQRTGLDKPFHLSMLVESLGTNWVFNSFEAAEFMEEKP